MNLKIHSNGYLLPADKASGYPIQPLLKFLRIMKIIMAILFLSLNVSASVYSQNISLTVRNAPFHEVLQKVRKQSGYNFMYPTEILKQAKPITAELKNAGIDEALKVIMKDQPFVYDIEEKSISIRPKPELEKSYFEKFMDVIKAIIVRGKVVDTDGKPLPGASVSVGGKSAVSDVNGEFSFTGIEADAMITISYVGYIPVFVRASDKYMTITMQATAADLEEVVINKGYYDTKKILNTGSVGTVKAADIAKQPVSDPLIALAGRVTGVYVNQNSGIPGAYVSLNIRGRNSLSNGLDPLYVVDGVPFNSASMIQVTTALGGGSAGGASPFTSIRPEDIESIDILKDADATAIYGSRGANGVVLITTKKGKAGGTRVTANVYHGASTVSNRLDLLNTEQFMEMRNEGYKNDNGTPTAAHYDLNGTWDKTRYTDWQDVFIGGTAKVTNANVSLSGGNAQTQFLLGGSYRKETTVFPGEFNNQIGSANLNVNHQSENKRLQVSLSTNYSNNNNFLPQVDFTTYIYTAPNAPALYNSNGQLNWENNTFYNPLSYLYEKARIKTENLVSNVVASYEVIDNLRLKASVGYNTTRVNDNAIRYIAAERPNNVTPVSRRNNNGFNNIKSWIIEPQITYTKQINDHHFDGLIGFTVQKTDRNGLLSEASGFPSDVLIENIASATTFYTSSTFSQYRYNAVFARVGYNYKEKYVLNLTGRRDGSSRFGPGEQFGNFGAIGAAWVFSNESAMKDLIPKLSLGKLRASIGRTGNDQIQDYQYLGTYSSTAGYFGTSTLVPNRISNPNYRWETIDKLEGGLELGFFNDRLQINGSYFRNQTKNQLVGYSLPTLTGFTTVIANLPAVLRNTGVELEATTVNIRNKNFSWTTSANLTIPNSKLVSYPNFEASSYTTRFKIGEPLYQRYVYKSNGINPTTGIYVFEDLTKDGSVNTLDRYLVNVARKYYGGFNNTVNYKGISLDIFLQFVKQPGYPFTPQVAPGRYLVSGSNVTTDYLDRWKSATERGKYQKYTALLASATSAAWEQYMASDATIVDASFIRLKNVALSWQLPIKWTSRAGLRSARIYAQGQNLLTFTKFGGADPETQGFGGLPGLPTLRVFTGGIEISL